MKQVSFHPQAPASETTMLIGEYTHTIDDKNRLSLPAKFRQEMGKKVVVTPGLDNCLFVFTLKEWEKFSGKLAESSMLQADTRSFNRYILGGAVEADIDSIGRILVPDFLRARAGIAATEGATKVAIIGVQSRVEIWNEKSWIEYKKVVEKQADALAEKLGQVGML
ncbi:MAG: cell division protein MraZ, MraZ protein [Candidatus Taylorbacteria bacterium]|nr:cell division protein MraZ, MraZ protein [Candidatus Taylorbacteria bacterium]